METTKQVILDTSNSWMLGIKIYGVSKNLVKTVRSIVWSVYIILARCQS